MCTCCICASGHQDWDEKAWSVLGSTILGLAIFAVMMILAQGVSVLKLILQCFLHGWSQPQKKCSSKSTQTDITGEPPIGHCEHQIYLTHSGVVWHMKSECAQRRTNGEVVTRRPCSICVRSG